MTWPLDVSLQFHFSSHHQLPEFQTDQTLLSFEIHSVSCGGHLLGPKKTHLLPATLPPHTSGPLT